MGRWGHRMFENDKDLDIALELETGFDVQLNRLVHQTDMLASDECLVYYKTEEYAEILKKYIEEARAKLDGGMGDDLFKKYRNVDDHRGMFTDTNYLVVVLGALMMRAGAKIKPDDFEYLRTILPNIPSRNGFTLPWFDDCFRDPGKVQFAAALEHYKEGIPRDFGAPSCFKCGKIQADLDADDKLQRCGRCKMAHYCNKECQKTNWDDHKKICRDPNKIQPGYMSLNV